MKAEKILKKVSLACLCAGVLASQSLSANLPYKKIDWPADDKSHVNDSKVMSEWWSYSGKVTSRSGKDARNFAYFVTLTFDKDVSANAPTLSVQITDLDKNKVYGDSITINDASMGINSLNIMSEAFALQKNDGKYKLQAKIPVDDLVVGLDLLLMPLKKPLFFGRNAAQRELLDMGTGKNSFAYAIPRLKTEGYIHIGKEKYTINDDTSLSRSWMEHYWGDFSAQQIRESSPWVWMGIQLDDETDINVFEAISVQNRRPIGEAMAAISLPNGDADYKKATIEPGAVRVGGFPQSYTVKVGDNTYELNNIQQGQLSGDRFEGLMSVNGNDIFEPNASLSFVENTVPPESSH